MKPVKFKSANAALTSPQNWNDDELGQCETLPIVRAHGCIYSCWKPSFWERVKLVLGHPVQLIVASPITQPPIAMTVGEP